MHKQQQLSASFKFMTKISLIAQTLPGLLLVDNGILLPAHKIEQNDTWRLFQRHKNKKISQHLHK